MPKAIADAPSGVFNQIVNQHGPLTLISAHGELFNHYDGGWPLWSGHGDRELRVSFQFERAFERLPSVLIGLTGLDSDHEKNLRFELKVDNVSLEGFEAVFVTWSDSRYARGSVSWTAIGVSSTLRLEKPGATPGLASTTKK